MSAVDLRNLIKILVRSRSVRFTADIARQSPSVSMARSYRFTGARRPTVISTRSPSAIPSARRARVRSPMTNVSTSTPVGITYKPTMVSTAKATVTISTDDPNLPMFQVALTGMSTFAR